MWRTGVGRRRKVQRVALLLVGLELESRLSIEKEVMVGDSLLGIGTCFYTPSLGVR